MRYARRFIVVVPGGSACGMAENAARGLLRACVCTASAAIGPPALTHMWCVLLFCVACVCM